MPLHYILDGFNVARSRDFSPFLKSNDPKISLINFIRHNRPCGSKRNNITVVFDGRAGLAFRDSYSDIEVVFSGLKCADSRIRSLVHKSKNPKEVIVVSDDNDLCRSVKLEDAGVMSTHDFILRGRRGEVSGKIPKVELKLREAYKITEELRKIWLR